MQGLLVWLVVPFGPYVPAAQVQEITLPAEVKGLPGDFIEVHASTQGEVVRWMVLDPGLKLFPVHLLRDTSTAVVSSTKAGRYRLAAWTAVKGVPTQAAVCVIVLGEPDPPPPPPPPPAPPNLFQAKLQASFTADAGLPTVKESQRKLLVGLYQAMQTHADSPSVTTLAQLLDDLRKVGGQMLIPDALVDVRKLIAAELAAAVGSNPAGTLDPATRAKAKDVFFKIAQALEGVK